MVHDDNLYNDTCLIKHSPEQKPGLNKLQVYDPFSGIHHWIIEYIGAEIESGWSS